MSNTIFHSQEDASVNFVTEGDFPGKIEARYVRRTDEYFICYLSSMTGCDKACRMCHLTQTGQTKYKFLDIEDYQEQAWQVCEHYVTKEPAKSMHFNFMSRGEVFCNPRVIDNQGGSRLCRALGDIARDYNVIPKFKYSTIMPLEMKDKNLSEIFQDYTPDIYYSLYSMDPTFRKRWLPKALDPLLALEKLKDYQDESHKIIKLHWAFIEGENDSIETLTSIVEAIKAFNLRVDFNVVRYNPYSTLQGKEPEVCIIERNAQFLKDSLPGSDVKIIGKVGFDVKASCGMFVGK